MKDMHKWEKSLRENALRDVVRPPDMVWQRIEKELDRKRRRVLIFWSFFMGLLVLVAGVYLYRVQRNYETKAQSSMSKTMIDTVAHRGSKVISYYQESNVNITGTTSTGVTKHINSDADQQEIIFSHTSQPLPLSNTSLINHAIITGDNSGIPGNEKAKISVTVAPSVNENTELNVRMKNTEDTHSKILYNIKTLPSISTSGIEQDELNIPPLRGIKTGDCYQFGKNRTHVFVQTEAGVGIPMRQLKASGASDILAENIKETVSPWFAYNASLQGGLIFGNNLFISSGLNYTEIKEKFDYIKTGVTQIVINIDPITNQPIDTSVITGKLINSGENTFQLINIPLSFGLQQRMGKWAIIPEIGGILNIRSDIKGKVLFNDRNINRIENHRDMYRKTIGYSLYAGVAVHYLLNDKMSIYLKPYYVKSVENWTLSTASFESSFDLININLGLRYIF